MWLLQNINRHKTLDFVGSLWMVFTGFFFLVWSRVIPVVAYWKHSQMFTPTLVIQRWKVKKNFKTLIGDDFFCRFYNGSKVTQQLQHPDLLWLRHGPCGLPGPPAHFLVELGLSQEKTMWVKLRRGDATLSHVLSHGIVILEFSFNPCCVL